MIPLQKPFFLLISHKGVFAIALRHEALSKF